MDHLCYFCLVLLCLHALLFVDALWSPAVKWLIAWHSFVISNFHFPIGILGQACCLIVSISDLCHLSYFHRRILQLALQAICSIFIVIRGPVNPSSWETPSGKPCDNQYRK